MYHDITVSDSSVRVMNAADLPQRFRIATDGKSALSVYERVSSLN